MFAASLVYLCWLTTFAVRLKMEKNEFSNAWTNELDSWNPSQISNLPVRAKGRSLCSRYNIPCYMVDQRDIV